MNLKRLNDFELEQSFLQSVKREREALSDVLHHIVEVERRKLYQKRSNPSLIVYLKEHLKYSNGTAQRRIDVCCQYQDPKTGKQCSSRWNLQIDHIHPRWDNGSHETENLQVLCAAHNWHR